MSARKLTSSKTFFEKALARGPHAEELRIVLLQHGAAGAGRGDHIVEALEGLDRRLGDRRSVRSIAGIIGRLAATGLALRHAHRAAGVFQKLQRRKADRGAEEIDETGDEQPHMGPRRFGGLAGLGE